MSSVNNKKRKIDGEDDDHDDDPSLSSPQETNNNNKDKDKYKYIAYVGCYTSPGQADPFINNNNKESRVGDGVPHDKSKIGKGILALGITYDGKLQYYCCACCQQKEPQKTLLLVDDAVVVNSETVPNPSYLCLLDNSADNDKSTNSKRLLLCVVSEVAEEEEGKMYVFAVSPNNDSSAKKFQQIGDAIPTGGSLPCHITAYTCTNSSGTTSQSSTATSSDDDDDDAHKKYLFVSNYGNGIGSSSSSSSSSGGDEGEGGSGGGASFTMYGIEGIKNNNNNSNNNGCTRIKTIQTILHKGRGSNTARFDRQITPHVHCSCVINNNNSTGKNDILVTDLGSDAIIRYGFRNKTSVEEVERLALPLGSGPRSIAFTNPHNANLSHIGAVSLEMTAQVQLLQCRKHDGCLEAVGQPISVLPPDWPPPDDGNAVSQFNDGKWVSDVAWSDDGRYLFVAARLHNSISVLELLVDTSANSENTTTRLESRHRILSGGITPRCLAVSGMGEFLLVAHQHSHDVSSFLIDQTTGTLTFVDKIEAPLAACIKMVPSSPEE